MNRLLLVLSAGLVTSIAACGAESPVGPASTPTSAPTTAVRAASPTQAASSGGAVVAPTTAQGTNTNGNAPGVPQLNGEVKQTGTGLRYIDEAVGGGAEAKAGQTVRVHYTGWLTTGQKFDSSRDRGQPFSFRLGAGNVIKGWDEGVAGMKVGGKRRLIIPPSLGYGAQGVPGTIPANSTLLFDVELLAVQ